MLQDGLAGRLWSSTGCGCSRDDGYGAAFSIALPAWVGGDARVFINPAASNLALYWPPGSCFALFLYSYNLSVQ